MSGQYVFNMVAACASWYLEDHRFEKNGLPKTQTTPLTELRLRATGLLFHYDWQSRFHDHVIRDEASLMRIRRYIRDNSKKWQGDKFFGSK